MALKIKYILAVFFLGSLSAVKTDETDFKSQFGEKFGIALKEYNAEIIQKVLDNFIEYYNLLLNDIDIKEHSAIRMRLTKIKEMKTRVGTSVTAESLKMSKNLIGNMLFEMITLYKSKFIADDPKRSQTLLDIFKLNNEKEYAALRIFKEKLQTKWRSMYNEIPYEELHKYTEYTAINDLMEQSTDSQEVLIKNIEDIWRKVTDFFNYDEFKPLFSKPKA